jgi:hypothetical protein
MILGSGPAGLFAAQAAIDMGGIVSIYSRGERSPLYGAQYLHEPIPGLDCGSPQLIHYILKGTVAGYRDKVYGPGRDEVKVSPETLNPNHQAWDIRSAYGHAWDRFKGLIRPVDLTLHSMVGTVGGDQVADLVVWSIPLQPFCVGGHGFYAQDIWAQGDAPELGRFCSVNVEPWTVVTNGQDSPRWYRASNVFGHRTAEWPGGVKPPVEGVARVSKPVATNCECWTELGGAPVLRVGRFGTWSKGELSHQAYFKTRAELERMGWS